MQNNKNVSSVNLVVAVLLSTLVIVVWGYFFPQKKVKSSKSLENSSGIITRNIEVLPENDGKKIEGVDVKITDGVNSFIINTKGLKLFSQRGEYEDYNSPLSNAKIFGQIGFLSQTHSIPNKNTVWSVIKSDKKSAEFRLNQGGLVFTQVFEVVEESLLKVKISVQNQTQVPFEFNIFARVNQDVANLPKKNAILHEGLLAFTDEQIHEKSYHKVKKEGFSFENTGNQKIWFGFSDKYTLATFIPQGKAKVNFLYTNDNDKNIFQADAILPLNNITEGAVYNDEILYFMGKKNLKNLESIAQKYEIPHLDKAIDFGFLYFATKPLFLLLNFVYQNVGSFAIAIVILTVLIKLILLPLTVKSSISMAKMKKLQPEIQKLQERHKNDKAMLGQATIKLYRDKKVNPLAGCLPMLVQMPIFFALYKVLYVSTEMKNAHLFFWIKDLSSPDPSSVLNLFGLLPFNAPPFLGVLPILFGISMFLYQKASPQPADKTQAQMMKFLPLIMTVFLSGFAAGLLFYWIVSNIISIIQQLVIEKVILPRHHKKHS